MVYDAPDVEASKGLFEMNWLCLSHMSHEEPDAPRQLSEETDGTPNNEIMAPYLVMEIKFEKLGLNITPKNLTGLFESNQKL